MMRLLLRLKTSSISWENIKKKGNW